MSFSYCRIQPPRQSPVMIGSSTFDYALFLDFVKALCYTLHCSRIEVAVVAVELAFRYPFENYR